MHGLLDITFAQQGKKTVAREIRQKVPLKVNRVFYPEGDAPAHVYILSTTGGIVEGDLYEISFHLKRGAQVLITTPAATRLYAMPSGEACQKTVAYLEPGAILEYLPEPCLPYAHSDFYQETEITIEPGAGLFYWDILGPGRLGRGECFAYRRYQNKLWIRDYRGSLLRESIRLTPESKPLSLLGVMEGYSHVGSLYIVGFENVEGLLSRIRDIEVPQVFWGATLLPRSGIAVRALSYETPALQELFQNIWACFRAFVFNRGLPPTRRY